MKPDLPDAAAFSPRRRWLGAIAAAAGAAWAWRARAPRAAVSTGKTAQLDPAARSTQASASVKISVRPSPDSVKRHG